MITSKVDTNFDYGIMPFDTDLIDRGDFTGISKSPIRYKVEGAAGSRILKIEWKNVGFYEEGDFYGTLNDFISFQLWLYEGSNTIEMHYGAHQVTDPSVNYFGETGPLVGLADEALSNIYLLSGNPANPLVASSFSTLNGTPANGTIYTFTKNNQIGLSHFDAQQKITLYPNPMVNELTVHCSKEMQDVEIHFINGFY